MLASPLRSRLLVRTRLFSFLINVFARESLRGSKKDVEGDAIAIINQGLMLAKICISESDLDGARLGLGKVTNYIDKLRQLDAETHLGPGGRPNIEAEYLTLRCALASPRFGILWYAANIFRRRKKIAWMLLSICTPKLVIFFAVSIRSLPSSWLIRFRTSEPTYQRRVTTRWRSSGCDELMPSSTAKSWRDSRQRGWRYGWPFITTLSRHCWRPARPKGLKKPTTWFHM